MTWLSFYLGLSVGTMIGWVACALIRDSSPRHGGPRVGNNAEREEIQERKEK
jgi:hypothetical protein